VWQKLLHQKVHCWRKQVNISFTSRGWSTILGEYFDKEKIMAKGQQRKNKEVKKPKKQPAPVKLSV